MEGKRILEHILRGDVQQLLYIQNYLSPLEKVLGLDMVNCGGKKFSECQQIVSKYGVFCMKLLRHCIETLSKWNKQGNGNNKLIQEECFKYAELGADMLSKLVTRGMRLPSEVSITGITKLLYHLIFTASKESHIHLLHFTDCLINITTRATEMENCVISKDISSICKQTSDHLWNAAIRLEQSKSLEKEKAKVCLSLRTDSLDLLRLSSKNMSLILQRGLISARQFQLGCVGESRNEELRKFLFGLLEKTVALICKTSCCQVEGTDSFLEDLCINCCKVASNSAHFTELLELFSCLIKKDVKKEVTSQGRFGVFQIVIQMLLCALFFQSKETNNNCGDNMPWSTQQKRLTFITEVLKKLDLNIYVDSRITEAMAYLRFICNKSFNGKSKEACSSKIPHEVLSTLLNLLLVCSDIQGEVFKSKKQMCARISTCSSSNAIAHQRLAMLYLASSLMVKGPIDENAQNNRRVSVRYDFVSAMVEAKTMMDDVVHEIPNMNEQYRDIATHCFNVGLMFYKRAQLKDATTLAQLSCDAADTWCLIKSGTSAVLEALSYKKHELLSDCFKEQGRWIESLHEMACCCQLYALSSANFAEAGDWDDKAVQYVEKWISRKSRAVKELDDKDANEVKRRTLEDGWKQQHGIALNELEMCRLLKMELNSYRRKGSNTSIEELAVLEKLESLFTKSNDRVNAYSMKLEKIKVMYQMSTLRNISSTEERQCMVRTCEEIITDLKDLPSIPQQHSVVIKHVLASSYFWCFLLQYSRPVEQVDEESIHENDDDEHVESEVSQAIDKVKSLELFPDFLLSLHSALKVWQELVDSITRRNAKDEQFDAHFQNEICWQLQLASSVYGFLDMPLSRLHTLSVLAAIARSFGGNENLQTVIVADSWAIHILCVEGHVHRAESLTKKCEEMIGALGEDCRPVTKYFFYFAKSQLLLVKGMYDDGWEMVKNVIEDINESKKPVFQLVLTKAKLLCSKYLSLPTCMRKTPLKDLDGCTQCELLLGSLKHAEALVDLVVRDNEVVRANKHKEHRGILLSHWSVLNELLCCLMENGKLFLQQGAVLEAKCYLEDGRNIASKYLSLNRFSQFTIYLAELSILKSDTERCEACLKHVLHALRPGTSLPDIVQNPCLWELPKAVEHSFSIYDEISFLKLLLKLATCFCQYLRIAGKSSDVKAVHFTMLNLRQTAIQRYLIALESLEKVFSITRALLLPELKEDALIETGKRKPKSKARRGKATNKLNEGDLTSELLPKKAEVASIAFLESGLKFYTLQSDVALRDGDYTTLLSSIQEGLELAQKAQELVRDPFLLDVMSTALLYYLRGVAHVLSSKTGFHSWNVAGCVPREDSHTRDIDEISEVMSGIDISPTIFEPENARACGRARRESGDEECSVMEQTLKETSWVALECSSEVPVKVDSRAKRKGRANAGKDLKPERSSKRTTPSGNRTSRNKVAASVEVATPIDELDMRSADPACTEMTAGKESDCLMKRSRSNRKNSKEACKTITKSATKTGRKTSRKKNQSSNNNNAESDAQAQISISAEVAEAKGNRRTRSRCSKKASVAEEAKNVSDFINVETRLEEDEEMLQALRYFQLSLDYLHPYYNPRLLTRICHALVLCYGLNSPVNAAIYHNLAMATTLRHQAVHRSAKKIRNLKDQLTDEGTETRSADELLKSFDVMTLEYSSKTNLSKLIHLRTFQEAVGFTVSSDELLERFNKFMDLLSSDLTICTLSVISVPGRDNVKHLLVTRLRKNEQSLVLKLTLPNDEDEEDDMEEEFYTGYSIVRDLSSIFRKDVLSDFEAIIRESDDSMKLKGNCEWWTKRGQIDSQLQKFLKRLEDTWFGKWRGVLSGRLLDERNISQIKSDLAEVQLKAVELFGAPITNEQLLEVLIEWYACLKPSEIPCAVAEITGMKMHSKKVTKFCQALEKFFSKTEDRLNNSVLRGPVVLILDKSLQHLPFESMPILRDQEVSRMPSLDFVMSHFSLQRIKAPASVNILSSGVDTQKTFYILNPTCDLLKTQQRFHEWFSGILGWNGIVGRRPSSVEFKEALSSHDLFLFFGHGNGRKFLQGDEVQRLYCRAVALLMGCSSGKLIVQGSCDARGMVLNYLLSGCPAVVGNLWDVTDGDTDRFCEALLKTWLNKDNKMSLTQCVSRCRSACKMKYLVGSAPVVYGLPVFTRSSKK